MADVRKGQCGEPREGQLSSTAERYKKALEAWERGDETAIEIVALSNEEVTKKFMEIEEYLNSLKKSTASVEVMATAEQQWMTLSTVELVGIVKNYPKEHWKDKPGEFWALLAVHKNRIKNLLEKFK